MAAFERDGWSLYYELEGTGPPLVFLAGTGSDHRSPSPVLERLREDFSVLSLDQRGIGRSGAPDSEAAIADYADDVAALATSVGWTEYACLGASFGGMIAQDLACRPDSAITRLCLACTTSGGVGGVQLPLSDAELVDPLAAAMRLYEFSTIADPDGLGTAEMSDEVRRVMFERFRGLAEHPDRIEGMCRQLRARAAHDAWDDLPSIVAPTLVCGGLYDGVARAERVLNLAERIPGSRIMMFRGGHFFLMEDRSALPTIIRFLRGDPS